MSFRSDRYYIVFPTKALIDLAKQSGFDMLINEGDGGVYRTAHHSHTGNEQPRDEFERAVWIHFLAGFELEKFDDPDIAKRFLSDCITLGAAGCWNVLEFPEEDAATEFVSQARELEQRAAENVRRVSL